MIVMHAFIVQASKNQIAVIQVDSVLRIKVSAITALSRGVLRIVWVYQAPTTAQERATLLEYAQKMADRLNVWYNGVL